MSAAGSLSERDVHALVMARDAFMFAVAESVATDCFVPEEAFFDRFAGAERDAALALYAVGRRLFAAYRVRCVTGTDPVALLNEHVHARGRGDPFEDVLAYRVERDGFDEFGRTVFALFLVRLRPPTPSLRDAGL